MDGAAAEDGAQGLLHIRARHIKKRALKNKSVSVSFNEKDLKDYVTGFHKRKKKRRKEALQQQEVADRKKRIELRKKRKAERDYAQFGGAVPESGDADAEAEAEAESDEEHELDADGEPVSSIAGTMMYDNGDMQVTVTTSEISREQEENPTDDPSEVGRTQPVEALEKKKHTIPVTKKKQLKKVVTRKRSRAKPQSKRDKRKGKVQTNRH